MIYLLFLPVGLMMGSGCRKFDLPGKHMTTNPKQEHLKDVVFVLLYSIDPV